MTVSLLFPEETWTSTYRHMKEISVRPLKANVAKAWATSHSHSLWIFFSPCKNRPNAAGGEGWEEKKKKLQWRFGCAQWPHLTGPACHSNTNPTWAAASNRQYFILNLAHSVMFPANWSSSSRRAHMGLCAFPSKIGTDWDASKKRYSIVFFFHPGQKRRMGLEGVTHGCQN